MFTFYDGRQNVPATGSNLSARVGQLCEEGYRPYAAINKIGIDELETFARPRIRDVGADRLTVHGAQDIVERWAERIGLSWR